MLKKVETLFSKNTEKTNNYRIKEKDRKYDNCWVDEKMVMFAVNNSIYSIYEDSKAVAEYYIFNSIEIGDLISKASDTNNEIERLLLIREIRDLSSSLGLPSKNLEFENIFLKKEELKKEALWENARRGR